ncbi:MAG: glycosyltransferase [Geitlerinemataceae cyanobacterium]
MKILLIGGTEDSIVAAQREPFADERHLLKRQFGITLKSVRAETLADISAGCQKDNSDVVFLFPSWRESAIDIERVVREIREDKPQRKLMFVDPFAQSSSNFFSVLPYVDRFLKRQLSRDLGEYQEGFIGGSRFTAAIAKSGIELNNWSVSSEVPKPYEHRIVTGWILGTSTRFRRALSSRFGFSHRYPKTIDIFCRMSLGTKQQKEWYCEYRIAAVEALKPLDRNYQLAASARFSEEGFIPRRQYERELKGSRIVFSPFGWGETCWRDFEAICYDCLLVKPSMEYLDTEPNIFIPGETYVPVRWDFADLEEKCRYYLENPEKADRIIQNARRVYTDYFKQGKFTQAIGSLIQDSRSLFEVCTQPNLFLQNL